MAIPIQHWNEGDRVRCIGGDADMIGKTCTVIMSIAAVGLVWVTPDDDPDDQWMLDLWELEPLPLDTPAS